MECALRVEEDATLPLLDELPLVLEYFSAGNRKQNDERFCDIAEAARDVGDHIHKGPSHVEFTFCTVDDEKMCDKCKQILAIRQMDEATWHPKTLLSPLAYNGYLVPWPVPQHPEPEHPEITAAELQAKVALEARIAALQLLLDRAVRTEDFLEASKLKEELRCVSAPLECQSSRPASSLFSGQSKLTPQSFRAVTVSHADTRPRYMDLPEVLRSKSRPEVVDVPISAYAKRLEGVHKYVECSLYLAKSQGELDHHVSHFHGKGSKRKAAEPVAGVASSSWQGYSVAGMAPVQERPKQGAKTAVDQDLVEDFVDGEGLADRGGHDHDDDFVDDTADPPERAGRSPAAQCTPDGIKAMRPLANERLGVGLYVDRITHHRFTAKYPNSTQLRHVSPDDIAALPENLKMETQSYTFGKHSSVEDQETKLEEALTWLWAKHEYFYQESRPEWTKRAAMEMDLDAPQEISSNLSA